MTEELCIHDLAPNTCATCLHGPTPRVEHDNDFGECRSCHAAIIWVVTENGTRMPLDPEPSSDGMYVKLRVDGNGDKVVHFVKRTEMEANTKMLYTTHFVTCPDADKHRKKR